jgi:hypothetical protein
MILEIFFCQEKTNLPGETRRRRRRNLEIENNYLCKTFRREGGALPDSFI